MRARRFAGSFARRIRGQEATDMIRLALAASLVLAFAAPACAASADEKALIDLENAISAAYKRGDVDFVAKVLDETYTLTNSHAKVGHRADDFDELRKHDPKYDTFDTHDMTARVFGDTGVVIGIVSLKGTSGGQAFDADLRFTDTFVRRHGRWQMVAAQVTRIEK
jgi:ketosteroid isomerase-like protein